MAQRCVVRWATALGASAPRGGVDTPRTPPTVAIPSCPCSYHVARNRCPATLRIGTSPVTGVSAYPGRNHALAAAVRSDVLRRAANGPAQRDDVIVEPSTRRCATGAWSSLMTATRHLRCAPNALNARSGPPAAANLRAKTATTATTTAHGRLARLTTASGRRRETPRRRHPRGVSWSLGQGLRR